MSDDINDNQKARRRGSKREELEQIESDSVQAKQMNLRDEIPKELLKVLDERDIAMKAIGLWQTANANRANQLDRQRKLLVELDEFMEPIYTAPQEWNSTLHMPVSLIIAKTFHARMYSALMGPDPQVRARKEANIERAELVEDLMRYTIREWANNNTGIESAMDDFVWEWVTLGRGILKMRWDKQFTRFVDVEERTVPGTVTIDEATGQPVINGEEVVEELVKKDMVIFEGPVWEHVPQEDVVIVGGDGDPDKADFVAQQVYMTSHELNVLADRGLFDSDAVDRVIAGGNDPISSDEANSIKLDRAHRSGENSPDEQRVVDRYQVLECYMKVDVDESGIASDVVLWVHKTSGALLRATYLWRVMQTGQKPFAVADFHRRKGQQYAVGLVELTYTLAKEIDAMHNMRIDFGVLSTTPFGFYRASSSLDSERLSLTPGELIPVDNPQADINFPVLGNRSIFAANEEGALFEYVSRVTSMSDLNFGILGAQGAARTATGARAVISESTNNLDIFLRRVNRAYKKALRYTFTMLQAKIPAGLEFRIFGDDGNEYFRQVPRRQELQGSYDFEIEPSSAATNKQIQIENAQQAWQVVQNPLLIQLGVVTQTNLFEAAKNLLEKIGMKEWSRYITKPQGATRQFTPEEVANRILSGIDVPLTPDQDLQGFVAFVDGILQDDEILGQFSQQEVVALAAKQAQAKDMLAALQQVAAQSANTRQMQLNAAQSAEQTAVGPNSTSGQGT